MDFISLPSNSKTAYFCPLCAKLVIVDTGTDNDSQTKNCGGREGDFSFDLRGSHRNCAEESNTEAQDTTSFDALEEDAMRADNIQLLQVAEILRYLEKNGNRKTKCVEVVTWQRAVSYNPFLQLSEQLGSRNMIQGRVEVNKGLPQFCPVLCGIENME